MSVGILVNCYNHSRFLEECLTSIFNQTYKDWVIYFFDNSSTDNSYDKALEFRDKNNIPKNKFPDPEIKMNSGVMPIGIARYLNFDFSLGYEEHDYIAIVDADDFWTHDKLEKQVKLMEEAKANICFSDCYYYHYQKKIEFLSHAEIDKIECEEILSIDGYSCATAKREYSVLDKKTFSQKHKPKMRKPFWSMLTKYNFMPCPTLMFKADQLFFDCFIPTHYTSAEDYYLLLKMMSEGAKVVYINEPLAYYRIHSDQITQKTKARCTTEEIDVVKRITREHGFSRNKSMRIYMHLFWLYMKLLVKEYIEIEEHLRGLE